MKPPFLALLSLVFFAGCALKDTTIALGDYQQRTYPFKTELKEVTLSSVNDQRTQKAIATVKDNNGENPQLIYAANDLSSWVKGALLKELGQCCVQTPLSTPYQISVDIVSLHADYTRSVTDTKNFRIRAKLVMTVKDQETIMKKEYLLDESKYVPMMIASQELEPHIQMIVADTLSLMINDIIAMAKK